MRTLSRYNNIWETFELLNGSFFDDVTYKSNVCGRHNETDTSHEYELELPGYSKKDVTISAVDGVITINAVRGEKTKKLSVGVPEDAELSSISGQLLDGLLTITVDKQERAKPITVKLK